MVSLIKSRRPNSRRNSSDSYIPCLPPNRWIQLLLKISPVFLVWEDRKGKIKIRVPACKLFGPNRLVVVRVLLHCQRGQWTTLLVNCFLCLSIVDEGQSGMNSLVLAIQPRTPLSGSTCRLFVRNKLRNPSKKQAQELFFFDKLKVARWHFWVTIPFSFERLEHYHYQFNRNQTTQSVLEKDESFK